MKRFKIISGLFSMFFIVSNCACQKLSVNDFKVLDTISDSRLQNYLQKKGYVLVKSQISESGRDKEFTYCFKKKFTDIEKALINGETVVAVWKNKVDGKWNTMTTYCTSDENDMKEVRKYCVENGFSLVWSPKVKDKITEHYEYVNEESGTMIDLTIDNALPKRKHVIKYCIPLGLRTRANRLAPSNWISMF
jgi:hypothetical protein